MSGALIRMSPEGEKPFIVEIDNLNIFELQEKYRKGNIKIKELTESITKSEYKIKTLKPNMSTLSFEDKEAAVNFLNSLFDMEKLIQDKRVGEPEKTVSTGMLKSFSNKEIPKYIEPYNDKMKQEDLTGYVFNMDAEGYVTFTIDKSDNNFKGFMIRGYVPTENSENQSRNGEAMDLKLREYPRPPVAKKDSVREDNVQMIFKTTFKDIESARDYVSGIHKGVYEGSITHKYGGEADDQLQGRKAPKNR